MALFSASERFRRLLDWFWTAVIVSFLLYIALNPELLSISYLEKWMRQYGGHVWTIYIAALFIRGVFMLTSTPFLFLGLALFPEDKPLLIILTMLSVLLSATFFYYFAHRMGWHEFFQKRYPKQTERIEHRLQQPRAIFLVIFWSFLPIFPTDLMCYMAGIVRMPLRLLLLGVFLGQLPLTLMYAYIGSFFF